jgi:hypothetical protein
MTRTTKAVTTISLKFYPTKIIVAGALDRSPFTPNKTYELCRNLSKHAGKTSQTNLVPHRKYDTPSKQKLELFKSTCILGKRKAFLKVGWTL